MSDNRYHKVTFFKFKYFICVCIMKYLLSIHTVSAQNTFGMTCSSGQICTNNLYCASGACRCLGNYYYDNSSRYCSPMKTFPETCSASQECISNLYCVSRTCECVGDSYYDSSLRSCFLKKPQGTSCSSTTECTSNLTCPSGICDCVGDFYYDSSSRSCLPKKPQGTSCSSTIECTSNLTCPSGICVCDGDTYYDSSSRSCSLKLDHGEECQSSDECKGSSINCTSYLPWSTDKCLCAGEFYMVNNSSCISQSNLSINPPNITRETRTVTFVWHVMSQRSDVSYSIRWYGSHEMNATETGVTVTGLEPGTLYSFSVVTSLPGDENYPPITVEQPQAPLWTRPDRPGPVMEVRREGNSTYVITFGQSNGNVSLYTMNVSSEGSIIEIQNSTSTVMNFTKLKPATTYIYVLESYNGNSEKSDPTTGDFTINNEARKDDETKTPFGAIVGGVLGGLALIAVIGVVVCLIRMAQSRKGLGESITENAETQVTSSGTHAPEQICSEHIELPQVRENSHIYEDIWDPGCVAEERATSVRYTETPRRLVNNVRSHQDVHQGIRESTESQSPYENVVSLNRNQDSVIYENYFNVK